MGRSLWVVGINGQVDVSRSWGKRRQSPRSEAVAEGGTERIKGVFLDKADTVFTETLCKSATRVGLISDTHGLIRPEALDALRDSDLIIHCGDVGNPGVIDTLRRIAPVRAVRGNNDTSTWARGLPLSDVVEIGSHKIYVLHNLSEFDLDPDAAGFTAVVFGHSHKPVIERKGKTLFINPGSAGPRRFKLPTTVARLTIRSSRCVARIIPLLLSK